MRKVRSFMGIVAVLAMVTIVRANLYEDFSTYAEGTSFNGTDQPGWRESGDLTQNWRVLNGTLTCNGGTATSYLSYYAEGFSISTGYTIMAKVQFRNVTSDYSGWYSSSQSDGTAVPTTTTGDRFYFQGGSRNYNNTSTVLGSGVTFAFSTNYYIRQYAYYDSGDGKYHVKMWYSLGVIDKDNPGTLFMDGTLTAPSGGFGNYIALLHAASNTTAITYWDNLTFAQGNYIPEPATMLVMGSGAAVALLRRRRK